MRQYITCLLIGCMSSCERVWKWLLSSLRCYSDDKDVPLLQLHENISSIYFPNYIQTFIVESLDS